MKSLAIACLTPEDTRRAGRAIGANAQAGDLYLLIGDLGAGKTTLTQGIAQGLGCAQAARSPTFVLVAKYQGRLPLYHADLYRVDNPLEALELGLNEAVEEGVCVVEWAEKAPGAFPADHLDIHISAAPGEVRHLTLAAHGPRYEQLLDTLRRILIPLST
jgi:tRNA threonylcarbamoyladenosine biosynthesis protein TsaE